MKLLAVKEVNDFEVVAGDWCEENANCLMAARCCGDDGEIIAETDGGVYRITVDDLRVCYKDVLYMGMGRYQCVTMRDIVTLTDDERKHFLKE